jgi:hypothetical protein
MPESGNPFLDGTLIVFVFPFIIVVVPLKVVPICKGNVVDNATRELANDDELDVKSKNTASVFVNVILDVDVVFGISVI